MGKGDDSPSLGRRALFRRLSGADARKRAEDRDLVVRYRDVLREYGTRLSFGAPEAKLPASKEEISAALRRVASVAQPFLPRATLRQADGALAFFCDDETAAVLEVAYARFRGDEIEGEEDLEKLEKAFTIRRGLLEEQQRRERGFDEGVSGAG